MAETIDLRAPRDPSQLGIPGSLVQDLTLRRTLYEGKTSTVKLSESLALSVSVTNKFVEELRDLRYLEVLGLEGHDYILTLTEHGREAANERMRLCRYAGATPVPLALYREVVRAQAATPAVTRQSMREAFSDLVVDDAVLDEIGPALISDGAIFLYGPPGTGKTSVAERLIRIHRDHVVVPRAVEVDSQIITVFDPVVHHPVEEQPHELDPRWVLCQRPSVITGGELTPSMLDLTHETSNGVYLAPLQMQANNGVLVVDDLGRQVMTPEQLLNRWIVPLDRRVDYLSLSYGVKFEIPFEVKVVFSTNIEPSSLGDEAFFRRIQNKIHIPSISDDAFDEVLGIAAERHGVSVAPGAAAYLRKVSRAKGDGDLRPYLPNEVCKILRAICTYDGAPLELTEANVDRVAAVYFTQHLLEDAPAGSPRGAAGRPMPAPTPVPAPVPTVVPPPTRVPLAT